MADSMNNMSRRQILSSLGGAGTVGLAGCGERELEPDNDRVNDQDNGNNDEPLDIRIGDPENVNLSDVNPSSTDPRQSPIPFSADTAKADSNIKINLTNGIQNRTHEASINNLEVEDDKAVLYLPQELLPHGDTELTATINGEEYNASFVTQTPSAFPIDRRVEGEQVSNFNTEWGFAQHNLDREEARKKHLEYINQEFIREPIVDKSIYDGTHGLGNEYDERIAQIEQMNPETEMLEILEIAGDITSDLEHDVPEWGPTGTAQSGQEIGKGAAQIIRDIHDIDLKTLITSTPDTGQDSIIQYNPASGEMLFQGTHGGAVPIERTFEAINPDNENLYKSMIFDFEPGEVEGIRYRGKSAGTQASIMSMANQEDIANTNYVMNDYFLAEASAQIFENQNVERVNDIASAATEMALATNQATDLEDRNPENNEDWPNVPESGRIAVYIGEDESIDDATLAYIQDERLGNNLYNRVIETPEPADRQEIEDIIDRRL